MSMSGSLMGYENNNDVSQAKCKKGLKPLPVVTSVNAAGVTTTGNGGIGGARTRSKSSSRNSTSSRKRESGCSRGHVNGLWSVWYGIIAVGFQAYIAVRCTRRFIAYLSLPWPADAPPPKIELHACLALAGAGVLLLPILLAAAFLKLGNLANDGIKLGRHLSTCSRDPPSSLLNGNHDSGIANNLWRHGGPTAAFVHLCTAMCFLLPSLLMEARLIHAGFLPKDAIWRTDLDWVVTHRDRLVLLSFMNIPENISLTLNQSNGNYGTSAHPYIEIDDDIDDYINSSSSWNSNNLTSSSQSMSTKLSSVLLPSTTTTTTTTTTTMKKLSAPITADLIVTDSTAAGTDMDTSSDMTYVRHTDTSSFPSMPTSSSSSSTVQATSAQTRRATSRMSARNAPRNRPKLKKNSATQRPKLWPSNFVSNMSAQSLPLTFNSLADLDHPESLNLELDETSEDYGPITLEYLNYAMALGVYSVRYPAVFWASNKALGTIFSIQLVANSAQSLLAYAGMSVLYKVQVIGPVKALPLLRHRMIPSTSAISNFLGDRFFLLNPHVTLGIFALSSLLVLCSSMVMYLYAYGRFVSFLSQERERRVILSKDTRADEASWTYMTHPAALCLFLAIAICSAPLLYDYTVVYRGSLDGVILACIIGTISHLVLWLILWVFLTIKRNWIFKLRVTIGRATVRSARSVKLVTDVDLMSNRDDEDASGAPLLVVGNGRTYTVAETSPKKAIMSVIQKAAMERKARAQGTNLDLMDGDSNADGDEQIYWLRPKLRPSPVQPGEAASGSAGQSNEKGWLNKKLKQKVTFNDLPSTSGSRNKGKGRRGIADGGPEDDGDYATLRELPLVTAHDIADDSTSEENKYWGRWLSPGRDDIPKFTDYWGRWLSPRRDDIPKFTDLLECVNDDQVTYYASGNRDLQPSEGEPSPLLSPSPQLPDPPLASSPLPLPPPTPTSQDNNALVHSVNAQIQTSGQTPRCLRRADSGMPHEELTPRSDSSHSPPLDTNGCNSNGNGNCGASTSSNSETSSSGVHSNASNASSQRRATSVEDLTNEPREEPQWRSCSLQRGAQPPTSSNGKFLQTNSNPGRVVVNPTANPTYVNHTPLFNGNDTNVIAGCPAVILENANEGTLVIRRKNSRPKLQDPPSLTEEPFGRSTNMRMTSFTENSDLRAIQASSATLPHYPTQPVVTYPHCSTMPLPHASSHSAGVFAGTNMSGSSGSCGSVPRHQAGQQQTPPPVHGTVPSHTTLPSHHNGVRLMLHGGPNPFVKRFPPVQVVGGHVAPQPWTGSGSQHIHQHHTFPQMASMNGKLAPPVQTQQNGQGSRHSDRDSANFSMASSGDSDTCLPH